MKSQVSESLSKDDMANILMMQIAYKVNFLKNMPDCIQELGYFGPSKASSAFTQDEYPEDIVMQALIKCVREGFLSLSYEVECPSCSELNVLLEPDIGAPNTLGDLRNGVIKCSYCNNSVSNSGSVKSIETVFSVAPQYRTEAYIKSINESSLAEELDDETFLSRILRWLKLKR